ncbi:general transcription factor 3C polypeptide 3 isoform X1 [Ixodes scapularis]
MADSGNAERAEDPFKSLLGEITEDQWETYKALKKHQGNLVIDSSSEDSSDEGDDTEDKRLHVGSVASTETPTADNSSDGSEDADALQSQSTLTDKYLNGEISFAEFTDRLDDLKVPKTVPGSEISTPKEQTASEESDDPFKELAPTTSRRGRRKGKRPMQRPSRLPKDLQGLMGEANLCFARGDHEDAIKMCMEVIRLVPRAPEPFQTLGMLYEEMGDPAKALQFSLIGAHLSPDDADEWARLGELSLEQGDVRQATTCYARAVRADPSNLDLRLELCTLYEQAGEQRKALDCCSSLVQQMGPSQGAQCLQLSRELAKVHHQRGNVAAAINVLQSALTKCPSDIASEDVNMLLELQLGEKLYVDALMVLHTHCGVRLLPLEADKEFSSAISLETGGVKRFESCEVPNVLPVDLRVKLVLSLIHLDGQHLVLGLVEQLSAEDPEEVGDLMLDVAEAFLEKASPGRALPLLAQLVESKNYSLAAVWLRYAECLQQLGRFEEATSVYRRVCRMAPGHAQARLALCSLLLRQGRTDEAIACLEPGYNNEDSATANSDVTAVGNTPQEAAGVLLRRAQLLLEAKRNDAFVDAAMLLLCSHCPQVETDNEYAAVYSNFSYRGRMEVLRDLLQKRGVVPNNWLTSDSGICIDDLWTCFLDLFRVLRELGRTKELQQAVTQALVSPLLNKELSRTKEMEFLSLVAHYNDPDVEEHTYSLSRALVLKNPKNIRAWNLFGLAVNVSPVMRHNRFCLRLLYKYPDSIPLGLLNGHNALVSGTYKHAIGEYVHLMQETEQQIPLVVFCVGLCLTHMACQKFSAKRYSLYVQAVAFLGRYAELRGRCQETSFNVARALHQLGLLHLAAHHYKQALEMPPPVTGNDEVFDLRREVAFNLSQLYMSSGNTRLASYYISKYCII